MAMPELAPGRPMNWQSFQVQTDSDSDGGSSLGSSLSYEESVQDRSPRQQKQREKKTESFVVENAEEIRELKLQLEQTQAKLAYESEAKRTLQSQLESANFSLRKFKQQVGTPLLYGTLDKSTPGPLATVVEKADASSKSNIRQVVCGSNHTLLLTREGDVYSWGKGDDGQLGLGDVDLCIQPTKITLLQNIKYIAASDNQSFAVSENNNVFAWGENGSGQLGVGDDPKYPVPTIVKGLPEDADVIQISPGKKHTLFLTDAGEAWSCGSGQYYQNGQKKKDLRIPVPIPQMEDFWITAVSTGERNSVLIAEGEASSPHQEPQDGDFKGQVDFLSEREQKLVKSRTRYLKSVGENLEELQRACDRLKRQISVREADGAVVNSASLLENLAKLAVIVANDRRETDPENLGQLDPITGHQEAQDTSDPANLPAEVTARGESEKLRKQRALQTQMRQAMQEGDQRKKNDLEAELRDLLDLEPRTSSPEVGASVKVNPLVAKVASSVQQLWNSAKETSLSELSRINESEDVEANSTASVRQLIRDSNDKLVELGMRAQKELEEVLITNDEFQEGPASLLAGLLMENIQSRKAMNDYTEGLLIHTVRKLEDYKGTGAKKERKGFGVLC